MSEFIGRAHRHVSHPISLSQVVLRYHKDKTVADMDAGADAGDQPVFFVSDALACAAAMGLAHRTLMSQRPRVEKKMPAELRWIIERPVERTVGRRA